ncbi:hypothetical protein K1Y78_42365 [Streptomyces sp. tea 10]|nr:hypothetical protein [Streptomyces sp. tea 10]
MNDELENLARSLEAGRPRIAWAAGEEWPGLRERLDKLLGHIRGRTASAEDLQLLRLGHLIARDPASAEREFIRRIPPRGGWEGIFDALSVGEIIDAFAEDWPERQEELAWLVGEISGRMLSVEDVQLLRLGHLIARDPAMSGLDPETLSRLANRPSVDDVVTSATLDEPVTVTGTSSPARPRFVNLAIEYGGIQHLVRRGSPLEPARDYCVRVDIGDMSEDSIVARGSDHPFPTDDLPPTTDGFWLEMALTSADFDVPTETVNYFLPMHGPGWACNCPPNGPHECHPGSRQRHVSLYLRTPETAGSAQARLSIWCQTNLVQSLLIVADIAPHGEHGDHVATVDYSFTAALTDLNQMHRRGLSIVTNEQSDGTHSLVFNGGTGNVAFTLAEAALSGEMNAVRQLLLTMHVEGSGKKRRNRLNSRNGKSRSDFLEDLRRLALHGWRLWVSLYGQRREILLNVTGQPSTTIQVARVPTTTFVFPWAAVYDIPLDTHPTAALKPCPVVESWDDSNLMIADYPLQCPEQSAHSHKNTLCPFGFWGIRHVIENPPATQNPSRQIGTGQGLRAVLAHSIDLDRTLTERHFNEVKQTLPDFALTSAASLDETCTALTDRDIQVIEFYCHGKGDPARHWLEVGHGEQIDPEQITTWSVVDWAPPTGPDGHWEETSPLVLLNGCHTAELTPQSPVNFVDAFASAHASGVVGTEITLHQSLAGEAAELLLRHFTGGQVGMGETVRRMRHDLLAKGNLLGLAYTAYCSSELRLAR